MKPSAFRQWSAWMILLAAGVGMAAHAWAASSPSSTSPTSSTSAPPPVSGAAATSACPALLQFTLPRLQDEKPQSLCQYAGKVVLMVNTASYCGFTSQYEGLEALHAKYASKGLVVLGFPSNDFGAQEPGSNAQIAEFCTNTYGVKFPMFAKTSVVGKTAHPLYAALAQATGGKTPKWNFHKYLIDRQGKVIDSYSSLTSPSSASLVKAIETALER